MRIDGNRLYFWNADVFVEVILAKMLALFLRFETQNLNNRISMRADLEENFPLWGCSLRLCSKLLTKLWFWRLSKHFSYFLEIGLLDMSDRWAVNECNKIGKSAFLSSIASYFWTSKKCRRSIYRVFLSFKGTVPEIIAQLRKQRKLSELLMTWFRKCHDDVVDETSLFNVTLVKYAS